MFRRTITRRLVTALWVFLAASVGAITLINQHYALLAQRASSIVFIRRICLTPLCSKNPFRSNAARIHDSPEAKESRIYLAILRLRSDGVSILLAISSVARSSRKASGTMGADFSLY